MIKQHSSEAEDTVASQCTAKSVEQAKAIERADAVLWCRDSLGLRGAKFFLRHRI